MGNIKNVLLVRKDDTIKVNLLMKTSRCYSSPKVFAQTRKKKLRILVLSVLTRSILLSHYGTIRQAIWEKAN